jgi:hypothetical protein
MAFRPERRIIPGQRPTIRGTRRESRRVRRITVIARTMVWMQRSSGG